MRKLSEEELDLVKKAIAAKELTSAEILVEIYDHYVSHLEGFESSEFESELFELEQKFTYGYCHSLQAKLFKASKKEILSFQWSIFKSYFTWLKFLATTFFFAIYSLIWMEVEHKTKAQLLIIPVISIVILSTWIYYRSFNKVRKIKKMIDSPRTIESSLSKVIMIQLSLITSSFNLLILTPKIFDIPAFMESPYFLAATLALFLIYASYSLTLFEAWKIKSRTALI